MGFDQYTGQMLPETQRTVTNVANLSDKMASGQYSQDQGAWAGQRAREANVGKMAEAVGQAKRAGQNVIGGVQGIAEKMRREEIGAANDAKMGTQQQEISAQLAAPGATDVGHQQQMREKNFGLSASGQGFNQSLAQQQMLLQQQQAQLEQQKWQAQLAQQTAALQALNTAGMSGSSIIGQPRAGAGETRLGSWMSGSFSRG